MHLFSARIISCWKWLDRVVCGSSIIKHTAYLYHWSNGQPKIASVTSLHTPLMQPVIMILLYCTQPVWMISSLTCVCVLETLLYMHSIISYDCFLMKQISVHAVQAFQWQVFQILFPLVFLAMGYLQSQGLYRRAIGTSHGDPLINILESVQCKEMMGVEVWLTSSESSQNCQETISEAGQEEPFLVGSLFWVAFMSLRQSLCPLVYWLWMML